MSGIPCPDCVDESNYQAWSRYLPKQIDKLLCAETMQTAEFQEELEKVRRDKEERIAHQKRLDEAAEVRRRRSCMARPKIDYMAKTEHSHPLGMVVSTHFRCGKGVKRGLKNGALPFTID